MVERTFGSGLSLSNQITPELVFLINNFANISNDESTETFTLTHTDIASFSNQLHLVINLNVNLK